MKLVPTRIISKPQTQTASGGKGGKGGKGGCSSCGR